MTCSGRLPLMARAVALGLAASAASMPGSAWALGWPTDPDRVVQLYRASDSVAREALLDALNDPTGSGVQDVILLAVRDASPEVRAAAAQWVARNRAFALESEVIALLNDRRSPVRAAAASALGELRTPGALAPLVRALGDRDPEVRTAAVTALGRLGRPEAVLALLETTHDSARAVVVASLEALAELGDPGALYAILEKIHDPVEEVAVAAASAAGAFASADAAPALIELAAQGREASAVAAMEALGRIGSRQATAVLVAELVAPQSALTAGAAADALVRIGDPASVAPLLPVVGTSTEAQRVVASLGVDAWGPLSTAWAAALRDADRNGILSAWLRSGDPAAVAAARAWLGHASGITDATRAHWMLQSPDQGAVCDALAISEPSETDSAGWQLVLAAAVAAEAGVCLGAMLDRVPLPQGLEGDAALALARSGAPDAAARIEAMIDPATLAWGDSGELIEALAELGDAGVPALERLLFSADARVVREAAWRLAEAPAAAFTSARRQAIAARVERVPGAAQALVPAVRAGDPDVAEAVVGWASAASPELQAEAWSLLAERCELVETSALAGAQASPDFWVRTAAARVRDACSVGSAASPQDAASALALAVDREAQRSERVAALASLVEASAAQTEARPQLVAALELATLDADEAVRASAWLALATIEALPDANTLGLRAVASDSALETRVLTVILRFIGADTVLERVERVEDDGEVTRLATAAASAHGSPLRVALIDGATGEPEQWRPLFVVFDDLRFELHHSDAGGRVVIGAGAVVGAYALEP